MEGLYDKILKQRRILAERATVDKVKDFDTQWGIIITQSNPIHHHIESSTLKAIQNDIIYSNNTANQVVPTLAQLSEHHQGLTLMNIFMLDILGRDTLAAKIFLHKVELDFQKQNAVSYFFKYCVIILLAGLNGFFIYFILLKAYSKGYAWQVRYMWSYIFQMLTEIILYETIGLTRDI